MSISSQPTTSNDSCDRLNSNRLSQFFMPFCMSGLSNFNPISARKGLHNYTQTHCELFHQTIHKHATHKTKRHINRATHNIQGYNITLTTSQFQEAIKQSKNNNLQGPDKLNIRHLKHIGPLGLAFLTSMF